ncbi:Dabb family protein [Shimia abyssi]|uniref:Stress responsive alpha/beta barrel protein n=1 Tax=Shimia abyssi TaxID=1662395 RepID=A0A2P8F6A3_9RHOB|nr:Dabb family protein [Shimia abyssi]PSL17235.1 stress responsive alpha/beta barrel protein [Shimia abyssi]
MTKTVLRHVVMLGFKDGVSEGVVQEIVERFVALKGLVPGIEALEWGVNNSPEGLNNGLSHCFLLDFATEAARDAYLPHPDHAAFADWVGQYVETVTVLDYWAT